MTTSQKRIPLAMRIENKTAGQHHWDESQADSPPSAARSAMMRKVKSKNTSPEIAVRSLVHALGYRFRLHRRDLAGTPDLVFPGKRKVIFVNGCFWHRHPKCKKASTPKTRSAFWERKFAANLARDEQNLAALKADGWTVLTIWECEVRDERILRAVLNEFLKSSL
jgi:DNA mismatch endonuclease, patch repair protein